MITTTSLCITTLAFGVIWLIHMHMSNSPFILLTDFDDSLTKEDTTQDLVQAAIESHVPSDRVKAQEIWTNLTRIYFAQTSEAIRSHLATPLNKTVDRMAELRKFLQYYADVDMISQHQVIESKILKGITQDALYRAAMRCAEKFDQDAHIAFRRAKEAHVVSANWSKRLITLSLQINHMLGRHVWVHANELEYDQHQVSTGGVISRIQSAADKEERLEKIRRDTRGSIVYVGDSLNDLLSLLAADVGILVGRSTSMRKIAKHYGIPIIPMSNTTTLSELKRSKSVLHHARDWSQIATLFN